MNNERDYYIAGGNDLAKVNEILDFNKAISEHWNVLQEKYGQLIQSGGSIVGIVYKEGQAPKNWRKVGVWCDEDISEEISDEQVLDYYYPKRLKSNKEIIAELSAHKQKTSYDLHSQFLNDGGTIYPPIPGSKRYGMRLLFIGVDTIGDKTILSVPNKSEFKPDGSIKLKMSQYYALVEEQEEKEAAENKTDGDA